MIFRQLFDPETSTYTYLLGDEGKREAILIDPVRERLERDVGLLAELGLRLRLVLETHVHADHVTAAGLLRERTGAEVALGARTGVRNADRLLEDGDTVLCGKLGLEVVATPGHTAGCVSYRCVSMGLAFTGDALLIRGCGRTDFQEGDARTLFRSVRERIFHWSDSTQLYPGHDYKGRTVTTVGEEKRFNPRLGLPRTMEEFVAIMEGLGLAFPARMQVAVPANRWVGLPPPEERPAPTADPLYPQPVALAMERLGRQDAEIWQGEGI